MRNLLFATTAMLAFSAFPAAAGQAFDLKAQCADVAAKFRKARHDTDNPHHNAHFLSGSAHKAMLELEMFKMLGCTDVTLLALELDDTAFLPD